MTTHKKELPYIDTGVLEDIEFIEANSPDVAIDLAVLTHVINKRDWYGPYKGWTNLSVRWFATHSRMGQDRVRAATKRLVGLHIIYECRGKGKWQEFNKRRPLRFRYGPHKLPEYGYTLERGEGEEKLEQLNATREKGRPPFVLNRAENPVGISHVWDKETRLLKPIEVLPSEYAMHPVCTECGRVFHPTEGRGRKEEVCAECSMLQQVTEKLNDPRMLRLQRAAILFPNGENPTIIDYKLRDYKALLLKTIEKAKSGVCE